MNHGAVWSALNEAVFSVGSVAPDASNLAISKIMWNPAPPSAADILAGFTDDSDFEFFEILTTTDHGDGTETVNCRCLMSNMPAVRFLRLRLSSP